MSNWVPGPQILHARPRPLLRLAHLDETDCTPGKGEMMPPNRDDNDSALASILA